MMANLSCGEIRLAAAIQRVISLLIHGARAPVCARMVSRGKEKKCGGEMLLNLTAKRGFI